MKRTYRVLLLVLGGVIGGYFGYWIGHLAGWSTNAAWPFRIGGGVGAIATSMVLAVVGVLVTGGLLALPARVRARRREPGVVTAEGSIVDRWSLSALTRHSGRRQFTVVVDVRQPDGTLRRSHATQWLSTSEVAALTPGHPVVVRYEPGHPEQVLVEPAGHRPIPVG